MYDSDGASFISSDQCKSPDVLVALTVAYEAPSLYYAELTNWLMVCYHKLCHYFMHADPARECVRKCVGWRGGEIKERSNDGREKGAVINGRRFISNN